LQSHLKILALILCLVVAPSRAGAQRFEVEGTVGYRASQYYPPEQFFKVSVLDCQWRIQLSNTRPGTNLPISAFETAFDGKDTSQFAYPADPNVPVVISTISGPVPLADGKLTSILWLAFCSRCYLSNCPTHVVKPVWSVDEQLFERDEYPVPATWTNLRANPGLLQNMTFYSDGLDRPFHGMPPSPTPLSPPFDKGYVQAVYAVEQTILTNGVLLPTAFSLKLYGPHYGGASTNDLQEVATWFGQVTRILQAPTIDSAMPTITNMAHLKDKRFAKLLTNTDSVNYMVTNVPATNDPDVVRRLQIYQKPKIAKWESMPARHKSFLAVFFVAALAGPVAFVFYRIAVSKQTRPNKKEIQ